MGGSSARASSISTDELLSAGMVVFGVVVFGVGALVGSGADCVVASAVAFRELGGVSVVLDFAVLPVFSVGAIFSEASDWGVGFERSDELIAFGGIGLVSV